ncbi:hypothetical protein [Haliovirga abyssi]|uniref:Uncharacterized protein n=1 Tax=Haliovirga abyssi TaxID=2996794 RepID=A0AAU9E2V6_9FUSO|nr:hypothetical protein [Haliovirga abyssi]BDU50745.1 hypothetical protein HLVA_13140 [Haliovirga abyssi]
MATKSFTRNIIIKNKEAIDKIHSMLKSEFSTKTATRVINNCKEEREADKKTISSLLKKY